MDQRPKKIRVAHFIPDSGERDRQLLFEFLTLALKDSCDLHFYILAGNRHFMDFLKSQKIPFTELNFIPKRMPSIIAQAWHLRKELKSFDIVHTHYHDANILGLIAGRLAGRPRCIYTRHHNSYFHDTANTKNIWINKFFNNLAHRVVAPSKSVASTLMELEHVKPYKVVTIHHPFSLIAAGIPTEESILFIRSKYGIPSDSFVIGAVSSFQFIKGTDLIVRAYQEVLDSKPDAILVLANAHGADAKAILDLVEGLKGGRVILITYENDILSLYKCFNVFIHTPRRASSEAFGQVYIESMALGIPGVFTLSGVLPEIAVNRKNCLVVNYEDVPDIARAVIQLAKDPSLSETLVKDAMRTVDKNFNLDFYSQKLLHLYLN